MGGGRKNMKRASLEVGALSLEEGQSIMEVVSLRGSNVIEVRDVEGGISLAIFPAKFQKSIWIKRGSFVVVDGSGKEKALESGSKISCMVSQILFHDQIRALQKSPECPKILKTSSADDHTDGQRPIEPLNSGDSESDGDDDLPPLEANLNRQGPADFCSDSDSE